MSTFKNYAKAFFCFFGLLCTSLSFAVPCPSDEVMPTNCLDCEKPVEPVVCEGTGSDAADYPWGPLNVCDECDIARQYGLSGVWLPEDPVLFRPFIADPHQITYSVGWRFNDRALTKNVIDVSFGDTFAVYRWCDVWPYCGKLQIEIEGAVWAVFDPLHESSPLINADYYVGFPLTYAFDRWAFRLRGYHISAHVGDEWLLDHPGFDRRNPSAESIDFFVSYELTDEIRLYDGLGYVVHQDESFRNKRFYAQAGAEVRLRKFGFTDYRQNLYGEPIFGMNFFYKGKKQHIDQTYVLGYELGKLNGLRRKARFFMEYHDGYSYEGQFSKCPTKYFSIRASYGF